MKRLLSILISLAVLAVVYWRIDFTKMGPVFRNCSLTWLFLGLAMLVPLTVMTAWRLKQLVPRGAHLELGEAIRLYLVACVGNLVLPSKMGDIAKAWFMRDRGHMSGSLALALVFYEKACDLLSLLVWCLFGLWFYPAKDALFWTLLTCVCGGLAAGVTVLWSRRLAEILFDFGARLGPAKIRGKLAALRTGWAEMHTGFWGDWRQLLKVTTTSLFIWLLHLLQIWMFILALHAYAPFVDSMALSSLAILAGLLPLTFAGIGTRDAALILFYRPYLAAPTAAALGVLCTMRYVLPALGGLPFAGRYLAEVKRSPEALGGRQFTDPAPPRV